MRLLTALQVLQTVAFDRPRACEWARQARRRSARVFELADRDEPAWLVARREPARHALGTLYSLDKLSGKAYRAGEDRLGRDGALNTPMTTSSRSGRRVVLVDVDDLALRVAHPHVPDRDRAAQR